MARTPMAFIDIWKISVARPAEACERHLADGRKTRTFIQQPRARGGRHGGETGGCEGLRHSAAAGSRTCERSMFEWRCSSDDCQWLPLSVATEWEWLPNSHSMAVCVRGLAGYQSGYHARSSPSCMRPGRPPPPLRFARSGSPAPLYTTRLERRVAELERGGGNPKSRSPIMTRGPGRGRGNCQNHSACCHLLRRRHVAQCVRRAAGVDRCAPAPPTRAALTPALQTWAASRPASAWTWCASPCASPATSRA